MPHDAYFQGNPTRLDVSRSMHRARPRWSGSWNVGRLIPIFATSSVMPGDTFRMSINSAIRMVRPVVPVMDDMEITIEAYFVPHRLVLSRKSMSPDVNDSNHSWSAFIGAQDSLLNMPTPGDVKLPCVIVGSSSSAYTVGSVGDCLGFHKPTTSSQYVNGLKALAYCSIWNEYFREPSTAVPVTYSITSSASSPTGSLISFTGSDAGITSGGASTVSLWDPFPVSRYHGYFGSALPWPQRNSQQVDLPLGDSAPVIGGDSFHDIGNTKIFAMSGNISSASPTIYDLYAYTSSTPNFGLAVDDTSAQVDDSKFKGITRTSLYADLSTATAASVNQFRLAVQTQRWYEALARSGNKYSDLINGMFGVRAPSMTDRPEYLGGFTAPINVSQVASLSGDASSGSLGDVGAFSLSNPSGFLFTKSFTEHGTLMVVACCRVRESFAQGIQREDFRFDRFDFYWTQFANLGEQPILTKELYNTGNSAVDDVVFGYQEAWAEYRMFNDIVTGYMNPNSTQSIGFYTYANYFASAPTLKGYLDASSQANIVDRTLSVDHSTAGFQLFGQFEFDINMVRPMPTYSIPGLVDHH